MSTGPSAPNGGDDSANEILLYVVSRVARAMGRAADDIAADHGVSLPELLMLLVLGEGGGFSGAQLARRTFVTPQSGHQVLGQLVERGLVERHADPSNRRNLVHDLTPEGLAVTEACRAAVHDLERRVLTGIADHDREVLMTSLLTAARTLRGGWFGDEDAEALATERRSRRRGGGSRT